MSRFIAPYGIRFQQDGRLELFPAVEVQILGSKKQGSRSLLHIDSGATISILPAGDGELLDLDIDAGKKMAILGIGGEPLLGFRHLVAVQIGGMKIKLLIIFIDRLGIPRILGREGVFNYFGIMFDESKRRTAFLDVRKERKAIDYLFSFSGNN